MEEVLNGPEVSGVRVECIGDSRILIWKPFSSILQICFEIFRLVSRTLGRGIYICWDCRILDTEWKPLKSNEYNIFGS